MTDHSPNTQTTSLRQLCCLVEGGAGFFSVTVAADSDISDLKARVHADGIDTAKCDHLAQDLVFLKVDICLDADSRHSPRLLTISDNAKGVQELTDSNRISYFWPTQPANDRLHILVRRPASAESPKRFPKEPRAYTQPSGIQVESDIYNDPPLTTTTETEARMASALEGFENYIQSLATGKLDGYLDSFRPEDQATVPGVDLPLGPGLLLLLHDLGKHEQNRNLFSDETVHLFSVSGSGKTRTLLEGLCRNWGLYISCKASQGSSPGSDDFTVATEILQNTCNRDIVGISEYAAEKAQASYRVFAMLLCARVFVLKQLVRHFPRDAAVARRRWVLAQVLPPRLKLEGEDLFVKVFRTLRRADAGLLRNTTYSMMKALLVSRRDLFLPLGLYVTIDDAPVAADYLYDMYTLFKGTRNVTGIIISGTSLSEEVIDHDNQSTWNFFDVKTDIGRFTTADSSQEIYIRQYLTLSDSFSDRRLLERMLYWFSGRYSLTARLIELLLHSENGSHHRILTSFAERLTGFKITDAIELEDSEPPISAELFSKIQRHQPICELDRLFNKPNGEELVQYLVDALMRWTLGNQPTPICIERDMHVMIALGIGSMDVKHYQADQNYPVYISEPLVVLSLSSLFEKQSWATKRAWMVDSFRNARNDSSSIGFVFEEVALVLMEIFGGKANALANAFHCSGSLGARRVTLVSLKPGTDGVVQCSPVSWKASSSDRFGLQATSPADVLAFLHAPDGKAFLFPDTHMGANLLCFLQDEETSELIVLVLQGNDSSKLDVPKWESAIHSLAPPFLYTEGKGKRGRYASTPRFLPVIADPDDEKNRLGGWEGDIATLRWDIMKEYIGSKAGAGNS